MWMYFYTETYGKSSHTINILKHIHKLPPVPHVLSLQQMDNKLNSEFPSGLSCGIKMTFTSCLAHYSRETLGISAARFSAPPVFSPQPAKLLAMELITSFQSNYR